jgi:hypothetical protein
MNKRYIRFAGLLLVCAFCLAGVLGVDRKDIASGVEASPGSGQRLLEQFVGQWNVEKRFYRQDGSFSITKLECRQTMINAGNFLRSEFFQPGQSNAFGVGFVGFDSDSRKFSSVWMDSRSAKMSIRRSLEPFDGQQINLFSRTLEGTEGEERASRDVTRLTEGGQKIIHQQYTINPDHTERLMLELILTKNTK